MLLDKSNEVRLLPEQSNSRKFMLFDKSNEFKGLPQHLNELKVDTFISDKLFQLTSRNIGILSTKVCSIFPVRLLSHKSM